MSCPNNEATKLQTRQEDTCKENCDYNFQYNPNSRCQLINRGDYLEIKTDGTNQASYNSHKLKLVSIRLYVPSLHTFDGKHTDAELILKKSGGQKNFMVCLPIKTSEGSGDSVNFFKQISSHIPLEKNTPVVVNVKNWSLNNVMPSDKTPFYNYDGNSPYPPCNMKATMVVFDEAHASTINESDLRLIRKTIKTAKVSSKEGFTGMEGFTGIEGFAGREGMVTYNAGGANNNDSEEQTMECTEYYDTDTSSAKTKTPPLDWSKITGSPAFIIIMILLVVLAGGIFLYYILGPLFEKIKGGSKTPTTPTIPSTTG